jgi:hypothetical protein
MPREPEPAPPTPPAEPIPALTPAVVSVFTAIASQAALIAALLYFFGRVRTGEVYSYFGVDASSLELSTSDYVVGSLNGTLPPVLVCALAILAVLTMAKRLDRVVNFLQLRPRLKLTAVIATAVVMVGCLIIVANGISTLPTARYSRGYPLPIAVLGIAAAAGMGRRLLAPSARTVDTTDRLWSMTVAAFALGGLLWVTDLYVAADGHREGRDIANTLRSRPDFVLQSVARLAIGGTVRDDPITQDGSRYHFQYSGLRLLIRTSRQYVILPADWQKGRDRVIFVPVDDSTRYDLIPH